jgi:hypothetical protein
MLSERNGVSRRTELLHECHAERRGLGDALTVGNWKVLRQNVKPLIFSVRQHHHCMILGFDVVASAVLVFVPVLLWLQTGLMCSSCVCAACIL